MTKKRRQNKDNGKDKDEDKNKEKMIGRNKKNN